MIMSRRKGAPVEIATQSLIFSALSISLPVASISSSRLSRALFTTRFVSSSESSEDAPCRNRPTRGFSFSSSSLISLSSSDESSDDELESSALFRKRDMAGFTGGAAAAFGTPSSSLDMSSSSSEDELSESESPA